MRALQAAAPASEPGADQGAGLLRESDEGVLLIELQSAAEGQVHGARIGHQLPVESDPRG